MVEVEGAEMKLFEFFNENILDLKKNYSCSGYKDGCKFTIWKTVAKKKVPTSAIKKLLAGKETGWIKGFESKNGKKFDAKLKLKADKSGVDFIQCVVKPLSLDMGI